MAFVYADRVMESSSAVGTGAFTLSGAVAGFQDFATGIGNTNETYYVITHDTDNTWEVGQGTVGLGSLSRDSVFASSNAGALVNFAAGAKTVFATSPATFYSNALSISDHAAVDHTGFTGVNSFDSASHNAETHLGPPWNLLDQATHDALDHTGRTGVNSFDSAAHDAVDHKSAPFNLLDEPAHDLLDHTGLTGAGLTDRQELIYPKPSMLRGDWIPDVIGLTTMVPAVGPYQTPTGGGGGTVVVADSFGPRIDYSATSNILTFPDSTLVFRSTWEPRVVIKHTLTAASAVGGATTSLTFEVGDAGVNSVQFVLSYDQNTTILTPWTANVVVSTVVISTVDMGISPLVANPDLVGDVFYFVVDWTSATTMTISVLDDTFAVLYTADHVGALNVPAFTAGNVSLTTTTNIFGSYTQGYYGVSLSYGAL